MYMDTYIHAFTMLMGTHACIHVEACMTMYIRNEIIK